MAIQSSSFKVSKPLALSKAQDDKIFRTILKYKGPLTAIAKQQFLASNPAAQATYTATRSKITSKRNARLALNQPTMKLSDGGGRVGQFGATVSPEYQRIQDEIAANKAAVEKKDLGIDSNIAKSLGTLGAEGISTPDTTTTPPDTTTTTTPPDTTTTTTPPDTTTTPPPDTSKDVNAENIQALGQKYLGRGFIQSGLDYYGDPDKKLSLDQIEKMISDSPEAKEYAKKQRGVPDKVDAPTVTAEKITQDAKQDVEFTPIVGAEPIETPDIADAKTVEPIDPRDAATVTPETTEAKTKDVLATVDPATGTVSNQAIVQAQSMDATSSAIKNLNAATLDTAQTVANLPERKVEAEELLTGPSVKSALVEQNLGKFEAAQGTLDPLSTIQGQLETLTKDFDASNPPAWAAGSMRAATAILNQRGLGASSLAGQAVIQAVMESALPIAQADAQVVANLNIQNLSNRQQRAVIAAQQRATFLGQEFDQDFQAKVTNAAKISDIANLNFSAQQQVALENARLAQSVDLANLTNRQALLMADAAQTANIETANLNNRQQAAVQNAQAFLQMDLTNLGFQQQTVMFKAQEQIKSLFTDAAAQNAAAQFNASSENQVNQFYDSLSTEVKKFNVQQENAMEQFEVSQSLAIDQFNVQQQNAVDQFNASNGLVVSQANAQWRQQIATIDTATQNQINQVNAQNALALTVRDYEGLWQEYRDNMQFAFNSAESILDRETELAKQAMMADATIESSKFSMAGDLGGAIGAVGAAYYNANPRNSSNTNSSVSTQVQPVTIQQPTVSQSQQNVINQSTTIGPGGGSTPGVTS